MASSTAQLRLFVLTLLKMGLFFINRPEFSIMFSCVGILSNTNIISIKPLCTSLVEFERAKGGNFSGE